MTKTFTLAEAQTLLPVLEALLRRAQAAAARTHTADREMQALQHRIFLSGGLHVNVASAAHRRAERDKSAQEVKDTVAEIEAIGARVQDLESGLLDFPSLAEGRTILLCWRLGEPAILHWHGEEESAEKRRSLETLSGKSQTDRPN
ncbi:MAG: hypothetical protein NVS9B15_07550 [Acidobacteriaceae bacterium]